MRPVQFLLSVWRWLPGLVLTEESETVGQVAVCVDRWEERLHS